MSYTIKMARQIYAVYRDEELGNYLQKYYTARGYHKRQIVGQLWDYLKDNGMFRKEIEEKQ